MHPRPCRPRAARRWRAALEPAEQDKTEQLTDTFLAQDDLGPHAGKLAENDELRRVQAEIRAKQEIETEHGQL